MYRNYTSLGISRDTWLKKQSDSDVGTTSEANGKKKSSFSFLMQFVLAFIILVGLNAKAQVSSYTFAQTTGAFTTITGAASSPGAILGVPTGNTISTSQDDVIYTASGFPFSFTFNGTAYTSCSISTNGFITFGGTAPATGYYTPISGTTAYNGAIAAWGKDSNSFFSLGGRTGELRWDVIGTAPNREVVIQWKDWHVAYLSSATTSYGQTYQIRLQENGNKVVIAYGPGSFAIGSTGVSGSTTTGPQIGLRGTSVSDFNIRTNAATALFTASTASGTNTTSTTQAFNTSASPPGMPSNGLTYTFSPPTPCSGTPTAGTIPSTTSACIGSTTTLAVTGYTTGVSGITFQWEESTDNLSFASVVGGTGATTATYTTAAIPATKYYRCKVICSNGGGNANTNVCTVNVVNCSFDVAKTANTFASISSTGSSLTGTWRNTNTNTDDNLSASQPIGFAFNYKGNSYSNFSASTNGFLTFNTGTAATGSGTGAYGYQNTAFTTSGGTGSILTIAPFYEDLVTPGNPATLAGLNAAIKYQLTGTSPNRVATIEWIGMETFNNAGPNLNFQVKLYETTGTVEIVYGTMEMFNGTANFSYTYTMGINGATMGTTPTVIELQSQQVANVQNFSNLAANALTGLQDCNVKYAFTPGTYSAAAATPTITNDEAAGAITLSVNSSPCTGFCGTYYKTTGATASAGIAVCTATTAGTPDDDVWFKFVASYANTTITVRGAGGYDAVLQLLDASLTPISCANGTLTGLTESLNPTTLTIGATYYVRVYHSAAGNGTTPEISICVNGFTPPPANDDVCGAISLTPASTCVTTSGSTLNSTASVQAVCGGTADDDVWYKFTALTATDVVTVQSGAGFNAHVQILSSSDNTCTGTLTSLSCVNSTSTGGVETYTGSGLTAGNTYYVRVYHSASGTGTGAFTICVTASTPACITSPTAPTNAGTACSGSSVTLSWPAASGANSYDLVIDGGSVINQTALTYDAGVLALGAHTWSVTPRNIVGTPSGCASWTFSVLAAPVAGTASGPATLFSAEAGTYSETGTGGTFQWKSATVSGGPYTNITGATTNPASISFATPGTYYVVLVRTVSGCTVATSTEVTTVVSVRGDSPCAPIALVVGSNGPYSNVGATGDIGEVVPPLTSCTVQTGWCAGSNSVVNSIWGTFVAPLSGRVTILAPSFDDQLALYSATNCSDYTTYTLIAANDDSGSANGGGTNSAYLAATCLTPGQTYYVKLDGYQATTGSTTIVITDAGNAAPTFAGCPSNIAANNDVGQCTAVVSWTPPVASDSDACIAPLTVTSSHAPGFAFPVGTTTVTYSVSDGVNAPVTCSFNVVVTVTSGTTYYVDNDHDGFGSTTTVISCAGQPANTATNNLDSNDNLLTYVDADADGFGSTVFAASGPTNNTDCNDSLVQYADNDLDGFGSTIKVACNGVTNSLDTNDALKTYVDADADGFGSNTLAPSGVSNNTDCNDAQILYLDADSDGYGSTAFAACGATNNTDCDDTNGLIYQSSVLYVDTDNDGFNNGAPAGSVCYGATPPTGYTANNIGTDCNDTNFEINPGHVEVLNNGIDDNCSGPEDDTLVDPTSYLYPTVCGTTMSSFYQVLYAYQVIGAEGYRFEITNGSTKRTIDTTLNSFTFAQLTGTNLYATAYTIRVAVKTGGFFRAYGTSCVVNSQLVPSTSSIYGCGSTVANFWTTIYASPVAAATGYRFRVTNGSNVRTFDTTVSRFSLSQLTGTNLYGTTYTVEVALRFGTTWAAEYSPACSISTPATPPTTRLIVSQCGLTISNLWATLYANPSSDAVSYRFEVVNGAQTRFFDTSNPRFSLQQLAGGAAANTVYTIRVAIFYGGVYQAFGPSCVITTSPTASRGAATDLAIFEANAYPNPFADTFKLDINTSSEDTVEVKVYDMIGKLVEQRKVTLTELGSQEVGSRYPTGVYNIVVTQGANVKTLRVIKR